MKRSIVKKKNSKSIVVRKEKIPATLRNAIWSTYISSNQSIGKCYCCAIEPITKANFAAGHVVAEARGGLVTLQNLRPICTLCNSSMGKQDMFHFIKKYGLEGGSLYTKHDTNDGTIVVYNRDQYTTSVKTFVTTLFTKLKEWLSSMYLVFAK